MEDCDKAATRAETSRVAGATTYRVLGEAVELEAREPRDRGESDGLGKGNSDGSSSLALAFPLLDWDLARARSFSASLTEGSDIDESDRSVLDDADEKIPGESDPDGLIEAWRAAPLPGLRGFGGDNEAE